jgi:MFS family permease
MVEKSEALATQSNNAPFSWYLTNQIFYFNTAGIASVLIPWLLTVFLLESADRIGVAQAIIMTPLLILLLFGGAQADRSILRSWLMRLHLFAILPVLTLAALIYAESLTFLLLIVYGVAINSLEAFIAPSRDSLLTQVAPSHDAAGLQKAVGTVIALQFGAQLIGIALFSQVQTIGPMPIILWIAVSYLACAAAIRQVPAAPPAIAGDETQSFTERLADQWKDVIEGATVAWNSERIRSTIILMVFSSFLFMGALTVLLPIMMREIYQDDGAGMAMIFFCFNGALGVSSMVLANIPIKRQGRALMLAMIVGGLVMAFMATQPPLWAFYSAIVFWGLSGGVTISMARTIVQTAAPESHRARILAVFTMGMMGGGPLGSLIIGVLIENIGLLNAAIVPAIAMVFFWAAIYFLTSLWTLEAEAPRPTPV